MNICIVSGSARFNNNTFRVGKALQRILDEKHTVSLIDFQQYDLPLVNQGNINPDSPTDFQKQLLESMSRANVIVIISPEYNYTTTPEILNMLHRLGDKNFRHLFDNKVFAFIGVSTGKGGKAPALHLTGIVNKIISYLNLDSVVSAKFFESHFTKEVLDEDGNSKGNAAFDAGLNDFANYTLRIAEHWCR